MSVSRSQVRGVRDRWTALGGLACLLLATPLVTGAIRGDFDADDHPGLNGTALALAVTITVLVWQLPRAWARRLLWSAVLTYAILPFLGVALDPSLTLLPAAWALAGMRATWPNLLTVAPRGRR